MLARLGENPPQEVRKVVLEVLGDFNKADVILKEETHFTNDLNFDSLLVMEFISALEDRLDVSVPLNILPDIFTVGDLIVAIEKIFREENG